MKSPIPPGTKTICSHRCSHRRTRVVLGALLLGGALAMIVPRAAEAFVLIKHPSRRVVVVEPRPIHHPGYVVSPTPFSATIGVGAGPCVYQRGHWGYWQGHRFIPLRERLCTPYSRAFSRRLYLRLGDR
jgi:hypothetical protein